MAMWSVVVRDKDPHKLYYRDVYLDAAKAVRILMSMDFVDEARVATTGKSQGGCIGVGRRGPDCRR